MVADPQLLARGMVTEVPHTALGPVKTMGIPIRLSQTPCVIDKGAPILGEDTWQVLADELDYGDAEINALIEEGAVVTV